MSRPAVYLKPKVEEFRCVIDLAWLRRTGARAPGYNGHITWSHQGTVKASVSYTVERAGLRLRYKRSNQAELISEFIPISTTASQFGGRRHWFSCPRCKRRCRMVYGAERFRCRLCLGAEYESKYQDVAMTIAARRWRIRQRLEEKNGSSWNLSLDHGLPPKPIKMHWKTYRRLQTLDRQLERRWTDWIEAWLQRTDPRLKQCHRLAALSIAEEAMPDNSSCAPRREY